MKRYQRKLAGLAVFAAAILFIGIQLSNFSKDTSLKNWANGFEGYVKSSRVQRESTKPIALLFYTDWCSSCKALRENILSADEVKQALTDFHPVKVNPERGSVNQALAKEYGVKGYPTFLVVNANGSVKLIQRTSGIGPAEFVAQLHAAKSG